MLTEYKLNPADFAGKKRKRSPRQTGGGGNDGGAAKSGV